MKPCYAFIPLLALLGGSLGCSRLDENPNPPDPSAVHIGLVSPWTGPAAAFGRGFANASRMAAQEINAAGGVNGKRIEILARDDKTNPAFGILAAQELVQEGVVGIAGTYASSVSIAIAKNVTIAAGIPSISISSSPLITTLEDNDTVYRTAPSDAFQGVVLAQQIRSLGVKSIGVIYKNNAYGAGLAQAFRKAYEDTANGWILQGFVSYSEEKVIDFRAEVSQLLAQGVPAGIVIIGYISDSASITRDLQSANPTPRPQLFGVDGNYDPGFLANASPQMVEGMLGTVAIPPVNEPNFQAFLKNYRGAMGEDPPAYSEGIYDAVYLMAYAMAAGGANTSKAIVANLRAVSKGTGSSPKINVGEFAKGVQALKAGTGINYEGASGAIDFDANGDVTSAIYIWWKVVKDPSGKLIYITEKQISVP